MWSFNRKSKRNIGSKNGNTLTLVNFALHKEIKDSNYNSKLGILGMVTISCLTLVTVTGLVFMSPLLQKQSCKCRSKKHRR